MKRGSAQILVAHGVCDLRSVLAIRRAFQLVPAAMHRGEADAADDRFEAWSDEPGSHSDDEDEGGDDGMAKSADKPMLRQQRAFELLLVTGHVVRFEVNFCDLMALCIRLIPYVSLGLLTPHRSRMDIPLTGPCFLLEGAPSYRCPGRNEPRSGWKPAAMVDTTYACPLRWTRSASPTTA